MTLLQLRDSDKEEISIHTSAREVTSVRTQNTVELSISIHTSAREVTEDDGTHGSDHNNFNPHFRKGSDVWCGIPSAGSGISIHTSAREVTSGGECAEVFPDNFNPHFRKGSDRQDIPHEIRNQHFNPHFRKGSDTFRMICSRHIWIFQSTLPQGK